MGKIVRVGFRAAIQAVPPRAWIHLLFSAKLIVSLDLGSGSRPVILLVNKSQPWTHTACQYAFLPWDRVTRGQEDKGPSKSCAGPFLSGGALCAFSTASSSASHRVPGARERPPKTSCTCSCLLWPQLFPRALCPGQQSMCVLVQSTRECVLGCWRVHDYLKGLRGKWRGTQRKSMRHITGLRVVHDLKYIQPIVGQEDKTMTPQG